MSYTLSPAAERRVAPRFQPTVGTLCRLRDRDGVALVWNISATGVSMLLADPPAAGEVVAGELVADGDRARLPVLMHVVHVRPSDTGDYLIGARFDTPLTDDQMRPFLTVG
jgi:hypothetical protein